jgi:hypothetical protein
MGNDQEADERFDFGLDVIVRGLVAKAVTWSDPSAQH